jgi:hypothetical protein
VLGVAVGNTEGRTEGEAVGTDVVGGRVGNVVGTLVIQTESPLQTRCNIRYNSSTVRSQVVSFSCGATRGVHNPQVFGQILAITLELQLQSSLSSRQCFPPGKSPMYPKVYCTPKCPKKSPIIGFGSTTLLALLNRNNSLTTFKLFSVEKAMSVRARAHGPFKSTGKQV